MMRLNRIMICRYRSVNFLEFDAEPLTVLVEKNMLGRRTSIRPTIEFWLSLTCRDISSEKSGSIREWPKAGERESR